MLKDSIVSWEDLQTQLQDLVELHEMASEENDTDTLSEIEADSEQLVVSLEGLEFRTMLDGDDDAKNAILVIHSGAGGTEAADWAEMLMRMYTRWTERNDMQSSIMDMQPGEEAGVKGVTIEVKGDSKITLLKIFDVANSTATPVPNDSPYNTMLLFFIPFEFNHLITLLESL